jgi:hypothetical protein
MCSAFDLAWKVIVVRHTIQLTLILILLLVFPSPDIVHRLYSSEARQQLLACAGHLRIGVRGLGNGMVELGH